MRSMPKETPFQNAKPRKRMGRPPAARESITREQFETLCKLIPTIEEVAGCFHVSPDTLERWVKKEYGETFAVVLKRFAGPAKVSLRRAQMKSALNGNTTMQIWLGKQWLGQSDKVDNTLAGKDGGPIESVSLISAPLPVDLKQASETYLRMITGK
jgi:AraC-like DNA-binding protein